MAFEHRPNSGTLFTNDRKTEDKHPDLKGQIKIGDKLMDIAGWWKQGSKGEFLSLKVSEPRQQQQPDANADEYQGEPEQNAYQQRTQQALRDSNPKPALPFRPRPRQ